MFNNTEFIHNTMQWSCTQENVWQQAIPRYYTVLGFQGTILELLTSFSKNLTIFFSKFGNELLWCYFSHFLLLSGDHIEQVTEAGEQTLFFAVLLLLTINKNLIPKWLAEVEGLQHRVTIACVSKLCKIKSAIQYGEAITSRPQLMNGPKSSVKSHNFCPGSDCLSFLTMEYIYREVENSNTFFISHVIFWSRCTQLLIVIFTHSFGDTSICRHSIINYRKLGNTWNCKQFTFHQF